MTINNKDKNKSADAIEWMAPEFEFREKDESWFFGLGLIMTAVIIYFALVKNFLAVVLFLLASFVLMKYANRRPRDMKFRVGPKGVEIGDEIYSFETLESFWIFYNLPEVKELSVKSKKTLLPYIKLPLGSTHPVLLREILTQYLPEIEQEEGFFDDLSRKIGF